MGVVMGHSRVEPAVGVCDTDVDPVIFVVWEYNLEYILEYDVNFTRLLLYI